MRMSAARRIDPDPVSIGLAILGALGSIASIASFVDQAVESRRLRKAKQRRFTQDLVEMSVELEAAVNEIQVHYEQVRLLIEKHAPFLAREDNGPEDPLHRPFEFGGMVLLLPKTDFNKLASTHQKILQASKILTKEVYRIIRHLHSSGIGISPETYGEILKLRTRMNRLASGGLDYAQALNLYSQLLDLASDVTRRIKQEFLPSYDGTPDAQRKYG